MVGLSRPVAKRLGVDQILVWPLLFKAIRKVLPAKAAAVVDEISEEPALAVAEHHHVEITQPDEGPARTEDQESPK